MAKKKKFVPTSDKEIASVYIHDVITELMEEIQGNEEDVEEDVYDVLLQIADKNLRAARLDKIIERIIERLEKMLAPVDKYLDTKK